MDRRQGKRPLSSDHESEEKEEAADHFFPVYSARSQQDMNAMVQALAQVIGNNNNDDPLLQLHNHDQNPTEPNQSHQQAQAQDQGIYIFYHLDLS